MKFKLTASQVADTLEGFVDGTAGPYDWDDFLSLPLQDPRLEAIRLRCLSLDEEFPPRLPGEFCSEEGAEVIREYVRELRADTAANKS
ncbi:MAG TPA: hypothetical protein VN461_23085 [Vicinamibacteria bacterium]|jgi:hypothetical protein|nr:hypothetical protein [Vicinamibacteria bacterium]